MPPKNAIEDFMTGADEAPASERVISPPAGEMGGRPEAVPPASEADTVETELAETDFRFLPLRRPIRLNGERITLIRMRPSFLEDIDDWSNAEITNRELLARLCGLPPAALKALCWDDAEALMEIFHQVVPEFVFAAPKDDA